MSVDRRSRASTQPFTCATCRIAVAGRPTIHVGLAFCCAGCAADGPCVCTYDPEDDEVGHELAPSMTEGERRLVGAPR